MTEEEIKKYMIMFNVYWHFFRDKARLLKDYAHSDDYWQSMCHEAQAICDEYKPLNSRLAHDMMIAIITSLNEEAKRIPDDGITGMQMSIFDLARQKN